MIVIVDYGLGNVRAFHNVYGRLNIPVVISSDAAELRKANKIILPGVGAARLDRSGLRSTLEECVLGRRVPVLGVCVGMQMLSDASEEGRLPGLGWVKGQVRKFSTIALGGSMRVPHMGWNEVLSVRRDGLFAGLERDARFYFLHSYYFEADTEDAVIAVTEYGGKFACAVRSANVYGVQFHPEKSHGWGMRLLENFAKSEE
jgi:glutamine amidotransferase